MIDLLETALDLCASRQAHERRQLAARAPEFAAIHAVLDALQAGGLLLIGHSVQILPTGFADGVRDQILITTRGAALARDIGAHRLGEARMTRIAGTGAVESEVWEHPDGWLLLIRWMTADDVRADACTAALPTAVAA